MLRCFCYFKPRFATTETAKINTMTPSSRMILPLSQSGCNWAGRDLCYPYALNKGASLYTSLNMSKKLGLTLKFIAIPRPLAKSLADTMPRI